MVNFFNLRNYDLTHCF